MDIRGLTLQKAVELGEYDPQVLAQFDEWQMLSAHAQLQLIDKGLDNCERQLGRQWAKISSLVGSNQDTPLANVLMNIEHQLQQLKKDRERLYTQFLQF